MEIIIIAIVATAIGIGSIIYTGKEDNIVEETSEYVIERDLGLPIDSIDLSPFSKEQKD